jgi:hypothetical protein
MKNQYLGDVNDYRKYGLLRALTGGGKLALALCWMLTPDDGRTDGRFTAYLAQPEKWRHYDAALYDHLRNAVIARGRRDVRCVERGGVLAGARYHTGLLPDDAAGREAYFAAFWRRAAGCDLVFFDPDNGLEVQSTPYGKRGSNKYLYWRELTHACAGGWSALVYQHFRRERRAPFIARMASEMGERTGVRGVYAFRTAHVVFFLLPAERMVGPLARHIATAEGRWAGQIEVTRHACA